MRSVADEESNTSVETENCDGDQTAGIRVEDTAGVGLMNLSMTVASFILYFVDIGLDVNTAYEIYFNNSTGFFTAAVIFIIVPAIIINLISWLCFYDDMDISLVTKIIHILLLGQVKRQIDLFKLGLKLYKKSIPTTRATMRKYRSFQADVALIACYDALLESDPQAILQLSLILPGDPDESFNFGAIRAMSVVASFLAVAFAIASYHLTLRMPQSQKNNISRKGWLIHWIWHLFITASRLISLSCLVSVLPYAVLIGGLVHIFFALIYLRIPGIGPERELESFWENLGFHVLISFAYLFYAIPVCDGPTRRFYTCMYFIFFVEDVLAVTYWYFLVHNNLALMILISSLFTFFLGISFMLLYYKKFHPTLTLTSNNLSNLCSNPLPQREV